MDISSAGSALLHHSRALPLYRDMASWQQGHDYNAASSALSSDSPSTTIPTERNSKTHGPDALASCLLVSCETVVVMRWRDCLSGCSPTPPDLGSDHSLTGE